jgi:hypothetical protein
MSLPPQPMKTNIRSPHPKPSLTMKHYVLFILSLSLVVSCTTPQSQTAAIAYRPTGTTLYLNDSVPVAPPQAVPVGTLPQSRGRYAGLPSYQPSYTTPTYRSLLPAPSYGYSDTGDSMRLGNTTYYSHRTPSGTRVTGDSMRLGSSTYHTLRDSNGNRWTGDSMDLGNSTYHTLRGSDGNRWSGDSMNLGNTTYHTFRDSNGNRVTGDSMRIGDTIYHSFRDSNGNRTSSTEYAPR